MLASIGRRVARESGLQNLYATGGDAWLIVLSRSTRMFAYGCSALVLALFFNELHVSDEHIGLFMTLTLAGDVCLSLVFSLVADRVGRRRTLFVGSVLMVLSGVAFALFENYWILLVAAVAGVISVTGGDFGPFRAVEESVLSELTTPDTRADVLVWYVTTASLGSAAGTAVSGRLVEWMRAKDGWTLVDAYHGLFWVYSIMGAVNMASSSLMSERCELQPPQNADSEVDDTSPLLRDAQTNEDGEINKSSENREKGKGWFAQISKETRSVMYALWFLLMVDSLADGMVGLSMTSYFLDDKFHLSKAVLGDIFSVSFLLSSCGTIFASPLARRIGLVNTMVFTHIPSSAAVLFFPLTSSVTIAIALLLLRVGLNNMDQAPRAALIAAVVRPQERTAVMGITSMLRTLASMTGPSVTGLLAGNGRFWIAFVVAGALRLAYDLGLFTMFLNIQLYRHEAGAVEESSKDDSKQRGIGGSEQALEA